MSASNDGSAKGPVTPKQSGSATSPNSNGPAKSPTSPNKGGPANNYVSPNNTSSASDSTIIITATSNLCSSRNEKVPATKAEKKKKTSKEPAKKVEKQQKKTKAAARKAEKKKQKAATRKVSKKNNKGKAIESRVFDPAGRPVNLPYIRERDRLSKIWAKELENEITLTDTQYTTLKGIYEEVMDLDKTDKLQVFTRLALTGKATGKEITTLSGLFCFILSKTQGFTDEVLPPYPGMVITEEMRRVDRENEEWEKANKGPVKSSGRQSGGTVQSSLPPVQSNVPLQGNAPVQNALPAQNAVPVQNAVLAQIDPNFIYQCIVNAKAWGWI